MKTMNKVCLCEMYDSYFGHEEKCPMAKNYKPQHAPTCKRTNRDSRTCRACKTESSEHTPTPWTLNKYGKPVATTHDFMGIPWSGSSSESPEAKANTTFIVRAVNAHEELVSLLDKSAQAAHVAWQHSSPTYRTCNLTQECQDATRAIAKAEGK
jgi:hypothetical protein